MKKIIIIYEKAGGGHKQVADILKDILEQDDNSVEIEILTPLELIEYPFDNFFTSILVNKFRMFDIPFLTNFIFCFLFRIFIQPWFIIFGTKKFVRAIEKKKPDILISTISGLNTTFEYGARQLDIPFFVFITVISIYADLLAKGAKHICYFQETADIVQSFPEKTFCFQPMDKYYSLVGKFIYPIIFAFKFGVVKKTFHKSFDDSAHKQNNLSCIPIGILRHKQFYDIKKISADKYKKQLGIPNDKASVLISSGSLGGRFLLKCLKLLLANNKQELVVFVLCGKDKKLYKQIEKIKVNSKCLILKPLGYIENVHEYLRAVDVVVSRGTCGIFLEALLCECPLVVPEQIDKFDRGVVDLLKKYELGEVYLRKHHLPETVDKVLKNRQFYVDNIVKLLKQTNSFNFDIIALQIREMILKNK